MTPYEACVQSVVIVPREPTDTMVACGEQASQMMEWQVRAAWAAMVLSAGRWLPTEEYEGPDKDMHDTEIPDDDPISADLAEIEGNILRKSDRA